MAVGPRSATSNQPSVTDNGYVYQVESVLREFLSLSLDTQKLHWLVEA